MIFDLIGQESSGKGDLAVKSEEILRKAFILGYELVRFIPKMLGVTQPSVSISVKRGEKIKRSPKASN